LRASPDVTQQTAANAGAVHFALSACDKFIEKVSEKAAEQALESAMLRNGIQATFDLSSGLSKTSSTDASRNTSATEVGGAKVSEAELGVNRYPEATAQEGGFMRTTTPEGTSLMASYESKDSVDKVAAFYRAQLKAKSAGKQFMDNSGPDSAMLVLADESSKQHVQILVSKTDTGSSI
jgi:hypothetical protein